MEGELGQPDRERAIGRLAVDQHGVVSAAQLAGLGVSRGSIDARLVRGRLHLVHRGVYAVGHPLLSAKGRAMAAVLAAGGGAVLSHRSAADLWELRPTASGGWEVTSPRRAASRPGIRVHRVRELHSADVAALDGIPVTGVARTLLDLGAVVGRRELERACDRAEVLRVLDLAAVADVLDRHPYRRGARALRAVLAAHAIGSTLTESGLEERFLRFCDRWKLPRPECNVPLAVPGGQKTSVDFVRKAQRVVVETDGWATHKTRRAFEEDRERDLRVTLARYRVIRITWRRLDEAPAEVAAALRILLAGP